MRRLIVVLAALATLTAGLAIADPAAAGSGPVVARAAVSMSGGDAIASTTTRCTAGWIATDGTQRFVLTAGSCTAGFPAWFRDGVSLGPTASSNGAYGVIRVSDPSAWSPLGGFGNGASVVRPTSFGPVPVGSTVCKTGSTTGFGCGVVLQLNITISFPGVVLTGLTATSLCSQPGDVGAPVFMGTRAVGIVVAFSQSGGCTSASRTYVLPIAPVLAATGLVLL